MDEPINRWLAAARGVHLAACMLLLGGWIFNRWIVTDADPTIAQPEHRGESADGSWRSPCRRRLLSGIAWFYFVADGIRDPDGPMRLSLLRLVWSRTQFGRVWQIRTILWIAAVFLAFVLRGSRAREPARPRTRRPAGTRPHPGPPRLTRGGGKIAAVNCLKARSPPPYWPASPGPGMARPGRRPNWHRAADVMHLLVCARLADGADSLGITALSTLPAATADTRRCPPPVLSDVARRGRHPHRHGHRQQLVPRRLLFGIVDHPIRAVASAEAGDISHGHRSWRDQPASRPIALPIRRVMWFVAIEAVLGLGIIAIVGVLGLLMPARM